MPSSSPTKPVKDQVTVYVIFLSVLSALGGFLFGYDTGIISGATLFIQEEFSLTHVQIEWVVGATTLGAIFGGVGAGYGADRVGRRPVMTLSSLLFLVGAVVLATAQGYWGLLAGRWILGLGVGLASMVCPMYISEVAPAEVRGRLVTLNVLLITGGQLVAYLTSAGLSGVPEGWRWMVGLAGAPALLQLACALPFLPESPRYLQKQGKLREAEQVLGRIYGVRVPEAAREDERVRERMEEMKRSLNEQSEGTYRELWSDLGNRRALLVACLLQALQQFSGFNTAMYYAASILRMAGFRSKQDAITFSLLVAGTNMVCTVVALRWVDGLGRRRILLWTVSAMTLALVLLGVSFALMQGLIPYQESCAGYGAVCGACIGDDRCLFSPGGGDALMGGTCWANPSLSIPGSHGGLTPPTDLTNTCSGTWASRGGWITLSVLVMYVASYGLGLGHVPWLVQSEMFDGSIRGRAAGVATGVNWTGNLVVSVTFLSLTRAITASGTFWLYAAISFLGLLAVYRWMPETKGKSLEEVRVLFTLPRSERVKGHV